MLIKKTVASGLAVAAIGAMTTALSTPVTAQAAPAAGRSPFYELELLAETGSGTGFTTIGDGVSINDNGTVAFSASVSGGDGVFVTDGIAAPRNLASAFLSPTRSFRETVQINNEGSVIARSRKSGAPPTYQLYNFDANNPDAPPTQVATGGPAFSPVDVIFSHASINATGQVVFPVQCFTTNASSPASKCTQVMSEGLLTPKVEGSSAFSDYNARALAIPLRPLLADDGRIVVKDAEGPSIKLFTYDLQSSETIACASGCAESGFTRLGSAPGIDSSGNVVVFTGDRGHGVGIFASIYDPGSGARRVVPITGQRWDGTSCPASVPWLAGAAEVIGLIGFDGTALNCFRDIELNSRVSVAVGPTNELVVSFLATPNKASAENPGDGGAPLLFSGLKGLFTVEATLTSQRDETGTPVVVVKGPRKVAQLGDTVAGETITAISLHDPLTIPTSDGSGNPRTPSRGDHRLAFHVATAAGGQMVLRATHLDSDGDGLLDHWETRGIDMDGDGTADLDLKAMGASPTRKDAFLEIDWLVDENRKFNPLAYHEPAPGVTQSLVDMFEKKEITLHIDAGLGSDRGRLPQPFSKQMGSGPLRGGSLVDRTGKPGDAPDIVYFSVPGEPPAAVPGVDLESFGDLKRRFFAGADKGARELAFRYVVLGGFGDYLDNTGNLTMSDPLRGAVASASNGPDKAPRPTLAMAGVAIPVDPSTGAPFDLMGSVVKITEGKGAGQFRGIESNTDKEFVLRLPWAEVPDSSSRFVLLGDRSGNGEVLSLLSPPTWIGLPGNDASVTLDSAAYLGVPSGPVQAGSIAHELGHTLGLPHCVDCTKDEYPSVMNYALQFVKAKPDYSEGTGLPPDFNDWANLVFDFQDVPLLLGNSSGGFRGAALGLEEESRLREYFRVNAGSDLTLPTATISVPVPETRLALGGDVLVALSAADDVALDSVLVAFDLDGDELIAPTETTTATSTGPGTFAAELGSITGPAGARIVLVSPIDMAGNVGLTSVAVVVTDAPPNRPPVAVDDTFGTEEDAAFAVPAPGVLVNDSDPDAGDTSTAFVAKAPANGTLTLAPDGSFTYTPRPDFEGTDTFTYQAKDAAGALSPEATVTITVRGVNDSPVARDDMVQTDEDKPLVIPLGDLLANDTDVDSDTLTVIAVAPSASTRGRIDLAEDRLSYIPEPDFYGQAEFTYTVADGRGGTATATAFVTVVPVNDPPSCAAVKPDVARLWPPDHSFRRVTLSGATDPEAEPATVSVAAVSQDEALDGLGDGDTSPDAERGPESNSVLLRAERSGNGDGRVYRVIFTAADPTGGSCSGTVLVDVPKSQGSGGRAVDSRLDVNSFGEP